VTLTLINWADRVWNPFLGCKRVSPGCDGCYAIPLVHMHSFNPNEKVAAANAGLTKRTASGTDWTGQVNLLPDRLMQPLTARAPQKWFVNSQSDVFHEGVPREFLVRVFAVMAAAHWHVFQVATKRHARMRALLSDPKFAVEVREAHARLARPGSPPFTWPLPNLWLGISAEDRKWWGIRVSALLDTPAAIRWVSAEPLLEELCLDMCDWTPPGEEGFPGVHNPLTGEWWPAAGDPGEEYEGRRTDLPKVDWVVIGGESGGRARPCDLAWIRSMRDQCQHAGTALWIKQAGTAAARQLGITGKGDDIGDLPADLRIRAFPETGAPS
jgi:protein gp37